MFIESNDLPGLRLLAGFPSASAAAAWLGLPLATYRRYESAGNAGLSRCLRMKSGDLGAIDPAWAGWRLVRGELHTEGESWRPGDIMATVFHRQLLAEYRRQVRQFQGMEPQPYRARPPQILARHSAGA